VIRVVVDPGVFISALIGTRGGAPRARREFVERIRRHAMIVDDPIDTPPATRDRKDDYLVVLALQERVDAIVSGDRDLVDAGLEAPPVWSPRQLADRIPAQ